MREVLGGLFVVEVAAHVLEGDILQVEDEGRDLGWGRKGYVLEGKLLVEKDAVGEVLEVDGEREVLGVAEDVVELLAKADEGDELDALGVDVLGGPVDLEAVVDDLEEVGQAEGLAEEGDGVDELLGSDLVGAKEVLGSLLEHLRDPGLVESVEVLGDFGRRGRFVEILDDEEVLGLRKAKFAVAEILGNEGEVDELAEAVGRVECLRVVL